MYRTTILGALTSLFLAYAPLAAQTGAESVSRLVASSQTVTVAAGDAVPFTVDAFDSSGALLHVPLRITGPREAAEIVDGMVHGMEPGEYEIVVTVVIAAGSSATPPTLRVPLVVTWPRPREVELMASATLFAGTTVAYTSRVLHADGSHRPDPNISWRSSAPAVATVDAFGNVPTWLMESGFRFLAPINNVSKWRDLWANRENDGFVATWRRLEKWSSDNVPFPGEVYRQYIRDTYQTNAFALGRMHVAGERVDLAHITCPLLTILAERDHIVPKPSAMALVERAGSIEKTVLSYPTGHIGLSTSSKAPTKFWPPISDWLIAHD